MTKLLLVDFSWIINRYAYGFKDSFVDKNGEKIFTGSILGLSFFVERVINKYKDIKIVFCMDGKCNKKKLNEDYKANRTEDKTHIYAPTPHIINILSNIDCVAFAKNEEFEADDLIANMAYKFKDKFEEIIIYSGDKDFWQLAEDFKVSNEYDKGFKFISNNRVFEKFGVGIDNLLGFRVLDGDPSDNLKAPVARIKTELKKIIAEKWTPTTGAKFVEIMEDLKDSKWKTSVDKYMLVLDKIDEYLEIMDLRKYSDIENRFDYEIFKVNNPDRALINYYELRHFEKFVYDYIKSKSVCS